MVLGLGKIFPRKAAGNSQAAVPSLSVGASALWSFLPPGLREHPLPVCTWLMGLLQTSELWGREDAKQPLQDCCAVL